MNKVSIDVATDEVTKWLDHKKIRPAKREALRVFIDNLIEAVCEGQLVLNDDFKLEYTLSFPAGEIHALTFKPRINDAQLEPLKRGIKADDSFERSQLIMTCGLTNQPVGVIRNLDTVDRSIADSISIFFL